MREVAAAAGVTQSTVSKAMRNDPTIPAARCAEIRKIAAKLGYRPHPMVSALMAQLHHHRRRSDPHYLAWLDLWPAGAQPVAVLAPMLAGAKRRAAELGYKIEVHRLARDGMRPERIRQILVARSQWGLIVPPVPESAMDFPLDLRGLTAVTIGTSLRSPVMHRVSPNHFQGATLACERIRARGFRRVGLVLGDKLSDRVEGKWLGAFFNAQQKWPADERLAPAIVGEDGRTAFLKWVKVQRPDAVLIAEMRVHRWILEIAAARQPRSVWLVREEAPKGSWGIDYRAEQIGGAAVDTVVSQIHLNERGSPEVPRILMLDSVWVES